MPALRRLVGLAPVIDPRLPAHYCPPVAAGAIFAPSTNDRAIADLVDRQDHVVIVSSRRPLAGYMPERQVIVHVH